MTLTLDAVVFDLGGVLIDWNPRYVYRSLFGSDEPAMERFLAEVCTPAWNLERTRLVPSSTVFVDDSAANVAAAAALGMTALRFQDPRWLRSDLEDLGLLPVAAAG